MALPAKKVSLSVVVAILLLFSAASFPVHARSRSYGKIQSTWDDDREYKTFFLSYINLQRPRGGRKYQTYYVLLRKMRGVAGTSGFFQAPSPTLASHVSSTATHLTSTASSQA